MIFKILSVVICHFHLSTFELKVILMVSSIFPYIFIIPETAEPMVWDHTYLIESIKAMPMEKESTIVLSKNKALFETWK